MLPKLLELLDLFDRGTDGFEDEVTFLFNIVEAFWWTGKRVAGGLANALGLNCLVAIGLYLGVAVL